MTKEIHLHQTWTVQSSETIPSFTTIHTTPWTPTSTKTLQKSRHIMVVVVLVIHIEISEVCTENVNGESTLQSPSWTRPAQRYVFVLHRPGWSYYCISSSILLAVLSIQQSIRKEISSLRECIEICMDEIQQRHEADSKLSGTCMCWVPGQAPCVSITVLVVYPCRHSVWTSQISLIVAWLPYMLIRTQWNSTLGSHPEIAGTCIYLPTYVWTSFFLSVVYSLEDGYIRI